MLHVAVLCLSLLFLGAYGTVMNDEDITNNITSAVQLEQVKFHLFNRALPPGGVAIGVSNSSSYLNSVFLQNKGIKMAVHGWLGSDRSTIVENITEVYQKEWDLNCVRIDWSGLAGSMVYPMSAMNVDWAATRVAELVDHIVSSGVARNEEIHLIGHSLGAHVMGNAGAKVRFGKVARITGLDPARPGFEVLDEITGGGTLDPSDAQFVDVIHTAGGAAGYLYPLGHADFYPNGGTPPQPGCLQLLDPFSIVGCSHSRSYEFYLESIRSTGKKFRSVQCADWNSYTSGACKKNASVFMGDPTPNTARGIFYLITNSESPFAQG